MEYFSITKALDDFKDEEKINKNNNDKRRMASMQKLNLRFFASPCYAQNDGNGVILRFSQENLIFLPLYIREMTQAHSAAFAVAWRRSSGAYRLFFVASVSEETSLLFSCRHRRIP